MFKNIEEIVKFIAQEDIANLEIRSVSDAGGKSVVFNSKLADKVLGGTEGNVTSGTEGNVVGETKGSVTGGAFGEGSITLKNFDLQSAFVEVFLAHKTLVIFADTLEIKQNIANKYSFGIVDDVLESFATPERDNYRDLVGEVASALGDIRENVVCYFADADNMHSIVLSDSTKYSAEKVKYTIQMVAKAYGVQLNKSKGVFVK